MAIAMRTLMFHATLIVAALVAAPLRAEVADNCAARKTVLTRLADDYGEARQSVGLVDDKTQIEGFASGQTGTWTIVSTRSNGLSGVLAWGQNFETVNHVSGQKRRND